MNKIDKKLKFKDNPRRISARQKELLEAHLQELGDLSGVVYCRLNKAYVGGNQRSDVFNGAKVTLTEELPQADAQGTVAHGFIDWKGGKYAYREVEFTPEQFRKACIVANNDGGEWDMETLATWDADELEEWGFEVEYDGIGPDGFGEAFTLPDGDKAPFQQMTFTFADAQAVVVSNAIADIKQTDDYKFAETHGNENSNGNALYLIVASWAGQRI